MLLFQTEMKRGAQHRKNEKNKTFLNIKACKHVTVEVRNIIMKPENEQKNVFVFMVIKKQPRETVRLKQVFGFEALW